MDIKTLVDRVSTAIRAGERVQIFSDFDDTLCQSGNDPLRAKIDRNALVGIRSLINHPNVSFTMITGRSAANMLARLPVSQTKPPFHIMGSHGTELMRAGGTVIEKLPLPTGADYIIEQFNKVAGALGALTPGLIVHYKHGCVNIDARNMIDKNPQARAAILAEARGAFEVILQSPHHPVVNGEKIFVIHSDTEHDVTVLSEVFNKGYAIDNADYVDRNALTIFMGDSLSPGGNDRAAALLVSDAQKFPQGVVIQVRNGRAPDIKRTATQGGADIILNHPSETGLFLLHTARAAKAQPRP
ncbi:HAD family hydrolase [Micavibrio aeruginosavorus]|uniref:Trehalose-phosphatase n=1 Tax=Micavibrio aeruginosavorus (strain ARL-13) TaxID=856793 RepID=G2KM72_MICAA|nr:trehalose-phosphatase [Micavibrio aeruginosavorus]AEP10166.1 hypothetical protein MICA_1855 [Micavibrio aeruginosavorus ARL-13]